MEADLIKESKKRSVESLLCFIDVLKPIFLLNIDIVKYAIEQYEYRKRWNFLGKSDTINNASEFYKTKQSLRADTVPLSWETNNNNRKLDNIIDPGDGTDQHLFLEFGSYEVSINDILAFFPIEQRIKLKPLVIMLSFNVPVLGIHVFLLDILSVLVLILQGPLLEKVRYLFTWYNLTGTGLLTEQEHSMLIQRLAKCLNKMKVIGSIDMTIEDANHIALLARTKYDGNKINFIPGLLFEDFYQWSIKESNIFFTFFRLLDRLVDVMKLLDNRTNAMSQMVLAREKYKQFQISVPKMDMFTLKDHTSKIYIIYRAQTKVSLCLSSKNCKSNEIFILCKKIIPVKQPLYDVPLSIKNRKGQKINEIKENSSFHDLDKCCEKVTTFEFYHRCYLNRSLIINGSPIIKVDICNLDPNSRYVFNLYSNEWKYKEIEVQTLKSASNFALENMKQKVSVCILPGSLSINEAEQFLKTTPIANSSDSIIFSGSICNIKNVINQSLLYYVEGLRPTPQQFATYLSSCANLEYQSNWEKQVEILFGIASSSASIHLNGFTPNHKDKQLLTFTGMGPWGSTNDINEIKSQIDPAYFDVLNQALESLYAKYTLPTNPPDFQWQNGPLRTIFVRNSNLVLDNKYCNSNLGISVEKLTKYFKSLLDAKPSASATALDIFVQENSKNHLVIILRTPLDLMSSTSTWPLYDEQLNSTNKKSKLKQEEIPIEEVKDIKTEIVESEEIPKVVATPPIEEVVLTGKHELIHGEYTPVIEEDLSAKKKTRKSIKSSSKLESNSLKVGNKRPKTPKKIKEAKKYEPYSYEEINLKDELYIEFIQTIFDWLRHTTRKNNRDHSDETKKVTLVSTGWENGCNFEIRSTIKGETLSIRHECLLETRKSSPFGMKPVTRSDYELMELITRLQSLPNCELSFQVAFPTKLRVISFQECYETSSKDDIQFIPINEILDKTITNDDSLRIKFPKVCIINGPRIVRLSNDSVMIGVTATGYGKVSCILYELPTLSDYVDAISFIEAERDQLIEVKKITKWCLNRRDIIFQFENLRSYSGYCVLIEPYREIPLVAHFRTFPMDSSMVNSVIVTSVSDADYTLPSSGISKIVSILDGCRPRALPVHLIHNPSNLPVSVVGVPKSSKIDLDNASKMANVIHTMRDPSLNPSTVPNKSNYFAIKDLKNEDYWLNNELYESKESGVHLSYNGRFCRISPRDGSAESLRKVIDIFSFVNTLSAIEHITVFSQRPLIRYLQQRKDDLSDNITWSCDGLSRYHRDLCAELFSCMLNWKNNVIGRDCCIITTASISKIKIVRVAFNVTKEINDIESHQSSRDVDDNKKKKLKKMKTTKVSRGGKIVNNKSFVSSTVAGSIENVESMITPNEVVFNSQTKLSAVLGNNPSFMETISHVDDHSDVVSEHTANTVNTANTSVRYALPDLDNATVESLAVSLRHIILPIEIGGIPEETIVFPKGICIMKNIEYEVQINLDEIEHEIHLVNNRTDMYGFAINLKENKEPAVYILDLLSQPKYSSGEKLLIVKQKKIQENLRKRITLTPKNEDLIVPFYHSVFATSYVDDIDSLQLLVGPIIGEVTHTEAIVQFEVNKSFLYLEAKLIPIGNTDKSLRVSVVIEKIKAYQIFTVKFEDLIPNFRYNIFLPDIFPKKSLGIIRTVREPTSFVQIALTGINPLARIPFMDSIIAQIQHHQLPDLNHIKLFLETLYHKDISIKNDERENTWVWIGDHFRKPMVPTEVVFHLGAQTFLTTFFSKLLDVLLQAGKKLIIPLSNASGVKAMYFKEMEEIIKDVFRLIWSIPTLKDALCIGSHIPIFHSDYLVPLPDKYKKLKEFKVKESAEYKIINVIRKLYEHELNSYICPLYNFSKENDNHTKIWRCSSCVVVTLDIVTDRKKLKVKKTKEDDVEGGGGKEKSKESKSKEDKSKKTLKSFSLGFLDKNQWQILQEIAMDKSITHLVICTQLPFIPLTAVKKKFKEPKELEKGTILEWSPTVDDLNVFFQFWISWIRPFKEISTGTKTIVLCSSNKQPYFTTILDIKTGLKIQQICLGSINEPNYTNIDESSHISSYMSSNRVNNTNYKNTYNFQKSNSTTDDAFMGEPPLIKEEDITMDGKIGTMRYFHKFTNLEDITLDSGRDGISSAPMSESDIDFSLIRRSGYGVIKMWFDTWKSLGSFSFITDRKGKNTVAGSAPEITCGPLLGAPYVTGDGIQSKFAIPIFFELDRRSKIVIEVRNTFSGEIHTYNFKVLPKRPFVGIIDGLDIENRYNATIVSPIKNPGLSEFVISTHINWSETNIAVINNDLVPGETPCAELILDLCKRIKIPFSGITALLHINIEPDFKKTIDEVRYYPPFLNALKEMKETGKLTPENFHIVDEIFELIRDLFRVQFSRPSSREILRIAYNLIMSLKDPIPSKDIDMKSDVMRMIQLMIARAYQEYLDQISNPHENVFRAIVMTEEARLRLEMQLKMEEEQDKLDEETEESSLVTASTTLINENSVEAGNSLIDIESVPENIHVDVPIITESKGSVLLDTKELTKDLVETPSNVDFARRNAVITLDPSLINSSMDSNDVIEYSDPKLNPTEAVFHQWINYMMPAKSSWKPWTAPNRKLVIEYVPNLKVRTLNGVLEKLNECQLESGNRLMIFDEGSKQKNILGLQECSSFTTTKFQGFLMDWKKGRTDRDVTLICPSQKFGSKMINMKYNSGTAYEQSTRAANEQVYENAVPVYMIDSILRCNEFDRVSSNAEKEGEDSLKKSKKKKTGGKSKAAKLKQEKEDREAEEERKREIEELVASQIPDGYLMVESRTCVMKGRDGADNVISNITTKILGSILGGQEAEALVYEDPNSTRPSPADYLQFPDWLKKFSPSPNTIFMQDEVNLLIRQYPDTKEVLEKVECDDIITKIIELYQKSRLCELSRPPDLREVELDVPGIIPMFLKDLIAKIWQFAVPNELKPQMVSLCDDFVQSYCLSRSLPSPEILADGPKFAKAIQYALVLSVTLKVSLKMSLEEKWKFIMDLPDGPTKIVTEIANKERRLANAIRRAKEDETVAFEESEVIQKQEAEEKLMADKADNESDIGDLDAEEMERQRLEDNAEAIAEEEERLKQEQEEKKQELEEQERKEKEEKEAADAAELIGPDGEPLTDLQLVDLNIKKTKELTLKVFEEVCEKCYEDEIVNIIVMLALEQSEEEETAAVALDNLVLISDEERLAEAYVQLSRLSKENVSQRRVLGKAVTHFWDL
jgi:hypothetical protein